MTTTRTDLLLLSPSTGHLFVVPKAGYHNVTLISGDLPFGTEYEEFIELVSGLTIHAPASAFTDYLVDDDQVHSALRAGKVDGLRAAHPARESSGAGDTISYAGNLIDPTWVFISVGGKCNSRCLFCYTEWIREGPDLPSESIMKVIEDAAKIPSVTNIAFSGGEPTLRNDLPSFLAHARECGYRDICIYSNGHRLAIRGYLRQLLQSGMSSSPPINPWHQPSCP